MESAIAHNKSITKGVAAFMNWIGPSFRFPLGMLRQYPQTRPRPTLLSHALPLSTTAPAQPRRICLKSCLCSTTPLPAVTTKAAFNGPVSKDGSIGGRGPRGLDGPFFSSDTNDELRWRDRVALYAQFSPEETLQCLLEALRENGRSGPIKDDGIEALYTFANFDVFSVDHFFFGKRMDLGQFERFRRVLITKPYNILLYHSKNSVLSSLRLADDKYVSRIRFQCPQHQKKTFIFSLSKVKLGNHESWMIDSVLEEPEADERQD